ncbi:MAG: asparagine synthetase B, partial [Candidatus Marinimicrobia bacterium]|nr:asparagine synthetase B [Candidatus Neomarinimicrobiota bacterium]
MSGISGILNIDGNLVKREQLSFMISRMRHRGPDGQNIWCDDDVGLGHCLLRTTPESLYERQPYKHKNLVIAADARIDNRQELLEKLELAQTESVIPDNELILHSYEKWGRECPEFLIGDFAFAIWDSARESLFLARDPFGIKQLFYYSNPGRQFAFATEIKSLLALPDVSENLNAEVLGEFLSDWPNPEETIYQDIVRLLPGHAMYVG